MKAHLPRRMPGRWTLPAVQAKGWSMWSGGTANGALAADLDGAEIRVDYDLSAEESVFILAHLFGHTVQWNLSAADREIGRKVETNLPESRLAEIERYERAACGYSLQLLHEVGVLDLDQWFSDFATCDLRYLMHFYRTGVKEEFRSFC